MVELWGAGPAHGPPHRRRDATLGWIARTPDRSARLTYGVGARPIESPTFRCRRRRRIRRSPRSSFDQQITRTPLVRVVSRSIR